MSRIVDLTGERFGRLTVLGVGKPRETASGRTLIEWICQCDCGKKVSVPGDYLKRGKTRSCGCLKRDETLSRCKKENKYSVCEETVYVELANTHNTMKIDRSDWEEWAKYYCWSENMYGYAKAHEADRKNPILLHALILPECPDGMVRDHINGDRLDNRRANLRIVSVKQNSQNKGARKLSKSGVNGVVWDKRSGKWYVQIKVDGKNKYLGRFSDIKDAISTRKQAEINYFGEYRRK